MKLPLGQLVNPCTGNLTCINCHTTQRNVKPPRLPSTSVMTPRAHALHNGQMERRRRVIICGCSLGLTTASLGAYLAAIGLEDADKLSSVLGLFIGLAGLVLAIYTAVASRSTTPTTGAGSPEHNNQSRQSGMVSDNRFEGPASFQTGPNSTQNNHYGQ